MTAKKKEQPQENEQEKSCFVMMPISDMEGYDKGHFKRVYEHIIKPSCQNTGFKPVRADEVSSSNFIVIDILKRIIESDLVICDLSGRNPNVLYELGVRQAFNLPTILLKDNTTEGIFDINGLRHIEYDFSLRIDSAKENIAKISEMINATVSAQGREVNSLIQLLGVSAATMPMERELSPETSVILSAIDSLASRMRTSENTKIKSIKTTRVNTPIITGSDGVLVNNIKAFKGDDLYLNGNYIGDLVSASSTDITINNNGEVRTFDIFDPEFTQISPIPF